MKDDLSALVNMIYSGRGIIVGMTPEGNEFVGYSLTGRSPSSQARELIQGEKSKVIRTSVTDEKQLQEGSPALLLYPAIVPVHNSALAISNGAQTKLIYTAIMNTPFSEKLITEGDDPALYMRTAFDKPFFEYDQKDDRWIDITTFEPDAPNSTPRISALVIKDRAVIHIVRASGMLNKGQPMNDPEYHYLSLEPGMGSLITTYEGGNQNPLMPFEGSVLPVIIGSTTPEGIAQSIYKAIEGGQNPGDNYQVSAAAMMKNQKTGELESHIINRFEKVEK